MGFLKRIRFRGKKKDPNCKHLATKDGYCLDCGDMAMPLWKVATCECGYRHRSALMCEHANESPAICRCDTYCYCKAHSCKWRTSTQAKHPGVEGWSEDKLGKV